MIQNADLLIKDSHPRRGGRDEVRLHAKLRHVCDKAEWSCKRRCLENVSVEWTRVGPGVRSWRRDTEDILLPRRVPGSRDRAHATVPRKHRFRAADFLPPSRRFPSPEFPIICVVQRVRVRGGETLNRTIIGRQ